MPKSTKVFKSLKFINYLRRMHDDLDVGVNFSDGFALSHRKTHGSPLNAANRWTSGHAE